MLAARAVGRPGVPLAPALGVGSAVASAVASRGGRGRNWEQHHCVVPLLASVLAPLRGGRCDCEPHHRVASSPAAPDLAAQAALVRKGDAQGQRAEEGARTAGVATGRAITAS